MLARKKKATFYLPEDLLRVARVHAARTDRRDSQVVEDALRAYLGYGTETSLWDDGPTGEPEPSVADVELPVGAPEGDLRPPELPRPVEPPTPLGPDEALALVLSELHALRDDGAGGR